MKKLKSEIFISKDDEGFFSYTIQCSIHYMKFNFKSADKYFNEKDAHKASLDHLSYISTVLKIMNLTSNNYH